MKKSILIIFLLFFTVNSYSIDFTLGALGGANIGWFSGDDWDDYVNYLGADNSTKIGFDIGLFFEAKVNNNFSIQPEILYTVIGGGLASEDQYIVDYDIFIDEELIYKVKIITLPLFLKYRIEAGDYFEAGSGHITFLGGPVYFILTDDINVKYKLTSSGYYPAIAKTDIEADNKSIFGMAFGVGYDIPLKNGKIFIDLRYYRFITGLFDDEDLRSNFIGINLGYGINL